ncbi:tyrosine-type recombinase/integrase [Chloroflexota bacterium]
MKGHIYQRAKGSWTVVYDLPVDSVMGKRRQKSQTVKGTKRDAQRILREILVSLEQGSYVKPNKITIGELLRQWLKEYAFMNTTDRTQESYTSIIERHLIPALGKVSLVDLQPQHIQSYYANKLNKGRADGKGGLSARSVVYHHRILSKALDYAVKMGLVVRNVAKVVEPPRTARVTMQTLSPEEVTRFLDAARETEYYVYFATLLYSGLRRGELLALRWRNLDLESGTLTVVETAYRLGNGEYRIKEPKTQQSRRTVTLPSSLVELFKVYQADQVLLRVQLGISLNVDDFVFIRPDGSPINPNAVTLAFRRIIKRAGLRSIRIHDLRHTHATLMLKAGVHPKVVSERLGHANIGITLDIYSHVLPGLQEAAAEKFDRIFEVDSNENLEPNVSKMLANGGEVECRPYRSRTCDTLIKSWGVARSPKLYHNGAVI